MSCRQPDSAPLAVTGSFRFSLSFPNLLLVDKVSETVNRIYEFGPFRLEVRERRLSSKGKPIRLRPKVFDTLCVLVERYGSLVDKDELMKLVWPETTVEENNLALNITTLRKALDE